MSQSTGNSGYHGFQLWLNRRFSEQLAFQAAYTWAHSISDIPLGSFTNSTTDPFNYKLDKGDADLDRRHAFVGNIVYVLPSFKNRGAAASRFLGDWQLNAIYSYFGSTPLEQGGGNGVTSGVNTYGTAGNIYPRPTDIRQGRFRYSGGMGLRFDTPVGPIRLEYGRKIDREKGESAGELVFSLGQSF